LSLPAKLNVSGKISRQGTDKSSDDWSARFLVDGLYTLFGTDAFLHDEMIKRIGTIEKAENICRPLKRALDKLIGVGIPGWCVEAALYPGLSYFTPSA